MEISIPEKYPFDFTFFSFYLSPANQIKSGRPVVCGGMAITAVQSPRGKCSLSLCKENHRSEPITADFIHTVHLFLYLVWIEKYFTMRFYNLVFRAHSLSGVLLTNRRRKLINIFEISVIHT